VTAFLYQSLAEFKVLIGQPAPDAALDARLTLLLASAGAAINEYCGRVFLPVTETRTFDAPAAARLPVADLQAVTAVTQAGTALVVGTDYLLSPYSLQANQPSYEALIRLQGGFEWRWGYLPASKKQLVSIPLGRYATADLYPSADPLTGPYAPYAVAPSAATIQVTGTWAYSASVPEPVVVAAEMIASRLWSRRLKQYQDAAAGPMPGQAPPRRQPLIDDDVAALLAPYVLPAAA
jgi:hypothetical protein